ncbi:MAG: hydroxymethylglutaryl-CoA reductase (NADPH) [Candidatus Methanomethylophilaceae archaeon]|nr:hydroxymethylglutaryl-CoA reductase (NADPH) [Candidatus Methanomethylophilaceae archaeon]MBR7123547.1 hydroxymethylglutaryl-CoA reductase (NADPH) [Candidatus Methanomethylophilaceae archaeon]
MDIQSGLKNRGMESADVEDRRKAVSELTETEFDAIASFPFEPSVAKPNIENMIGVVQIPLGFAGPVQVNGDHAQGPFLIPLATTEGALVASISRGMSVITAAGGANVKVFGDAMTRAPVFRVNGIGHASEVIDWVNSHPGELEMAVASTTSHGSLTQIEFYPNGRSLHMRLSFHTGDAMGMNMCTIAAEAICEVISRNTGAELVSVSGNMCTDKKPAAINIINGRGKTVVAEVMIPKDIVESKLHTSVPAFVETNTRKNLVGSAMAGSLGFNAHAANMVAALYLATGQDPAQVVEASNAMTVAEDVDGDLYVSVRMPSVEVGTVGGGTGLPAQSEALEMMGCRGSGKALKLAELVAVTVLAGEISTMGAQAAGHLGKAHSELGRSS